MSPTIESMGLLRLRNCCLFTWREREYGKGPRTVEVKPHHCVVCVRELRTIKPPVLIVQAGGGAQTRAKHAPRRVMVVDDDLANRESLAGCLEDVGCEVVTAANGRVALELLRSGAPLPGLILLDMVMPELDGPGFLRLQKQEPALASIPVVVISAAENLGRLGVTTAALRKPISLQVLQQALESVAAAEKKQRGWIMVVDDEVDLREELLDTLEDVGCEARAFANGREALTYLRSGVELPRLIFLDLAMPELDGYQFRQEQKNDPRLRQIPVVVLTGASEHEGLDVPKVLRKPVTADVVVEALAMSAEPQP